MRVGFNGIGELGIFRAGLGDNVDLSNTIPSGDSGSNVTISFPELNNTSGGDPNFFPQGTDGGTAQSGSGWDNIFGPSTSTLQTQCQGQGGMWKSDGCYFDSGDVCAAAGGSMSGGKCSVDASGKYAATSASTLSSALASIANIFRPTPLTANTAATCATAGGIWNGVTCAPKGTISLGGVALSTSTLLIGGVILLMLMKGKR